MRFLQGKKNCKGGLAVVIALAIPALARATTQTYTIDPGRSSLTIGGSLAGSTASAQSAGSLTTSFSGTIQLDRSGNFIHFLTGSSINAGNSGNQQPLADGTPGSAPASFGRTSSNMFGTTNEAMRDFVLDLQSPLIALSSNAFPSNDFSLDITAGQSAFAYGVEFGTVDLSSLVLSNLASTPSTLLTSGDTETLTLHVQTSSLAYSVATSSDSSLNFTGNIVATRSVPEPATLALLLPAAGLIIRRRRRV